MSADRELMELAAKAAGIKLRWMKVKTFGGVIDVAENQDRLNQEWRPLDDDGDALRLAVKLGIQPIWVAKFGYASAACVPEAPMPVIAIQEYGDDPCAAIRRAIVRAAAEIGRAMP